MTRKITRRESGQGKQKTERLYHSKKYKTRLPQIPSLALIDPNTLTTKKKHKPKFGLKLLTRAIQ